MDNRNRWLIWSSSASLVTLVVFFYLQSQNSPVLSLDTRWIGLALVPVLVALMAGGFIRKFKGFGIELETLLQNPVGEVSLVARDALHEVPGDEKRSMAYIDRMSEAERARIERLSFVSGLEGYYSPDAIVWYFERLPSLKYIETKKQDGRFVALFPAMTFYSAEQPEMSRIDSLIGALQTGQVAEALASQAVVDTVTADEKLIDILQKVRASRYGYLPVISTQHILVGVITTQAIEKRIADEVLAARKRT